MRRCSYHRYLSPENLDVSRAEVELVEGDIAVDEESRGSVGLRLWPGGVFVYDIESSLGKVYVRNFPASSFPNLSRILH